MRKILFIFSLFVSLSLAWACSDDDDKEPRLSFGRPIYILRAADSLAVELSVSEPVTETIRVPFTVDGTAVLDEDYTLPIREFTLQPGETMDTIYIYPKNNVVSEREIRLSLQEVQGFRLWNNRWAMIPVEIKDVFTGSFTQTSIDLKGEIVISAKMLVRGEDYMYKRSVLRVPFEIDPESTAVEGEHYEIVGGERELVMGIMKATADITVRFLKKEEGKDRVVLRLVEGGLFEAGTNGFVVINVNGPTPFKEFVGTWTSPVLTSVDFVKGMVWGHPNDCDHLPINNLSIDRIVFSEGAAKTLNVDGVQGDLAKYLRNCEVTYIGEAPEQLWDQDAMGIKRDVVTLELGKANVNYSATSVTERKAIILVRLLSKGKVLEFRVIDYEPTDFLTGTYRDQMNPGWGDPPQYPMRELYPMVFRFTKAE
ncbi:hypothetical protein [Butyricimonas synergistica]|uniref:hypothetical protein n=1 Tax=Butyricimonas synergistica TaxID=544644 RepID=UPI0003745599|nr:hypothetical protein [Butyricimonas synergistica]